MASGHSYYEILGVPRTASLDEIKKRYRELARQHHPDVNRDKPDAARRFAEITNAYKTLSDATSRTIYDADTARREQQAAAAAARGRANTFPGTTPPRPQPARPASSPRPAPSSAADTARLVAGAQAAFARGKFLDARALCEQILRRDRRSAQAYEILGDVYRLQGRTDDAIHMYTMALQINPRNTTVMQRLERLARGGGPTADRIFFSNRSTQAPGFARGPVTPGGTVEAVGDRRPLGVLLGGMIGYGLAFLLIFFLAISPGRPFGPDGAAFAPISLWNWTLITVMTLVGLTLGFTMAATAAIRRIDDELVLPGAHAGGGAHLPLGVLLIVVSVLSFYAAALLYGVIGLLQESITPSMVRVFGAVVVVVLLLTTVYTPGPLQVFLFGGNVVFLALLIGWALGDFFRPGTL